MGQHVGSSEARGTRLGYARGCRCDECRTAWAAYMLAYKRRRRDQRPREERQAEREIAKADSTLRRSDEDVRVETTLTPLDLQILTEIQRRSKRRRGDVIGQLLREHGPALLSAEYCRDMS